MTSFSSTNYYPKPLHHPSCHPPFLSAGEHAHQGQPAAPSILRLPRTRRNGCSRFSRACTCVRDPARACIHARARVCKRQQVRGCALSLALRRWPVCVGPGGASEVPTTRAHMALRLGIKLPATHAGTQRRATPALEAFACACEWCVCKHTGVPTSIKSVFSIECVLYMPTSIKSASQTRTRVRLLSVRAGGEQGRGRMMAQQTRQRSSTSALLPPSNVISRSPNGLRAALTPNLVHTSNTLATR